MTIDWRCQRVPTQSFPRYLLQKFCFLFWISDLGFPHFYPTYWFKLKHVMNPSSPPWLTLSHLTEIQLIRYAWLVQYLMCACISTCHLLPPVWFRIYHSEIGQPRVVLEALFHASCAYVLFFSSVDPARKIVCFSLHEVNLDLLFRSWVSGGGRSHGSFANIDMHKKIGLRKWVLKSIWRYAKFYHICEGVCHKVAKFVWWT